MVSAALASAALTFGFIISIGAFIDLYKSWRDKNPIVIWAPVGLVIGMLLMFYGAANYDPDLVPPHDWNN